MLHQALLKLEPPSGRVFPTFRGGEWSATRTESQCCSHTLAAIKSVDLLRRKRQLVGEGHRDAWHVRVPCLFFIQK